MKLSFEQMQAILDSYKFHTKSIDGLSAKDSEKIIGILQGLLTGTKQIHSFLSGMNKHEKDSTGKCVEGCNACRARQILQGEPTCDPKKTGPKSG